MKYNEIQIRVRYGETDQMGVVYHGNYSNYFEVGRLEWLRSLNISYKKMESKSYLDRNMVPNPCTTLQQFPLCKNTPVTSKQIKMYDFSQRDYCAQYPCQKVFNNMTKRKMYPNSYTPQDLNKIHTDVDYTELEKNNNNNKEIDKFFSEDLMCMPYSLTYENGVEANDCKSTPVKLRYY